MKRRDNVAEYVYFIQRGENGPIKIGRASDPDRRMKQLQTAVPERLQMLCFLEGDSTVEANWHSHFYAQRIYGEWFEPCDELLKFIGYLNSGDPDALAHLWEVLLLGL